MRSIRLRHLATASRYALLAGGLLFVGVFVGVAVLRLGYPFDLEWLEGAVLAHVRRILAGEPIYVPPSVDFVPVLYPPVYYYLAGAVASVAGLDFASLRLVSLASSLGCLVFVYLFAKKETDSTFAGLVSVALFAATYREAGTWLDIARVDSTFLFFVLAGAYVVRTGESHREALVAGVLLSLACLTKQSGVTVAGVLLLYAFLRDRRCGVTLALTVAVLTGGSAVLLHAASDGWSTFYLWDMPRGHPLVPDHLLGFWTRDLLAPLFLAVPLAVGYLTRLFAEGRKPAAWFHLALGVAMVATAWLSRLHSGGFVNTLIPAFAWVSILAGPAVHRIYGRASEMDGWRAPAATIATSVAVGLQFLHLAYFPQPLVPTDADRRAGERLVERIGSLPGEVLIPGRGYLGWMAGKSDHAHGAMMHDVLRAGPSVGARMLAEDLDRALRTRRFDAWIMESRFPETCPPRTSLTEDGVNWFCQDVHREYRLEDTLVTDPDVFWPVAGARTRTELLYRPR